MLDVVIHNWNSTTEDLSFDFSALTKHYYIYIDKINVTTQIKQSNSTYIYPFCYRIVEVNSNSGEEKTDVIGMSSFTYPTPLAIKESKKARNEFALLLLSRYIKKDHIVNTSLLSNMYLNPEITLPTPDPAIMDSLNKTCMRCISLPHEKMGRSIGIVAKKENGGASYFPLFYEKNQYNIDIDTRLKELLLAIIEVYSLGFAQGRDTLKNDIKKLLDIS